MPGGALLCHELAKHTRLLSVLGIVADMPESERAPRRWWQSRPKQIGIALLLFLAWSLAANQWTDKGCDAIPQSYILTVTHFGEPAGNEGCESEPDGPVYTDDYTG